MTDESDALRYIVEAAVVDRLRQLGENERQAIAKEIATAVVESLERMNISVVQLHAIHRQDD
jgi:aryl-alcohol dehydrogenase-like predicted oxidoreductase